MVDVIVNNYYVLFFSYKQQKPAVSCGFSRFTDVLAQPTVWPNAVGLF